MLGGLKPWRSSGAAPASAPVYSAPMSDRHEGLARFEAAAFSERLLRGRSETVSVCVPVQDEAATIGAIVDILVQMRGDGLLDQVVVVDGASPDGSADIAARSGATVYDQASLLPEFGAVRGKGDAMWRALSVLDTDIVAFFDGDLEDFRRSYVVGLIGPLLERSDLVFVKAAFQRPFRAATGDLGNEGGRVTEGMAKPLLRLLYPDLTAFQQPLSGQIAARGNLLRSLPISTGYGVDVGLLIDVYRSVGLAGMAEVDIGVLLNAHQALTTLEPMSFQVALAVTERLRAEGRYSGETQPLYFLPDEEEIGGGQWLDLEIFERPPIVSLTARS